MIANGIHAIAIWLMPLAQQVSDPNVLDQIQRSWNHFVASGQIWAFFIGILVGYFVRGMGGIG